MKNLLIIFILLQSLVVFPQKTIPQKIDSLLKSIADEHIKNANIIDKFMEVTPPEDVPEILNSIEKYKYNGDKSVRNFVCLWFEKIAIADFPLEIKQRAAYNRIDMFYISDMRFSRSYPRNVYSKKCKDRIIGLLNGLNAVELKINIEYHVKIDTADNYWKNQIYECQKKNGYTYNDCSNLIIEKRYQYWNSLYSNDCIDIVDLKFLVKVMGWLDDDSYITDLKELYKKSNCNKEEEYLSNIKYALARLGDSIAFAEITNNDYFDYKYLKSKEAYIHYVKNIKEEDFNDWHPAYGDGEWPKWNSAGTTYNISTKIRNFPKEDPDLHSSIFARNTEDMKRINNMVKKAIHWILSNQDILEITDYDEITR